jgi:CelD/BcsL family acetyltransferase involved in cellulose biosynthesis
VSSVPATPARAPLPRRAPPASFVAPAARALRTLGDAWRALAPHPFLQPEWLAIMGAMGGAMGALGEPLVYGVRREGELLGALPLALDARRRTLCALASDHTPRFDLLGDPAALELIFARVLCDARWDVLDLPHVPASSALACALPELARAAGLHVAIVPAESSPYFALAGFEERLGAKFRGNLRRRARKLPDLAFERIAGYDQRALEEGFALEAAGWKGGLGTAIACQPALARFYHAMARSFGRRGQLTLAFLRTRGQRIAFHFTLESDGVYFLLKPGFDPAFAAFGPGQLLVWEAAADAARRGLEEFDFLGWDMPWKRDWTDRVRAHVRILAYRKTPRGELRYAARHVLRPRARAAWRALRKCLT